jgi:vacuolar-type H+-ATPase subunit H
VSLRPRNKPFHPPSLAGGPGDLERLLETEARLEEMVRRAREEAARLVSEAQAAAQAREAALGAELEEAARRLEADIAAERARREQEIGSAARREAERFDRVPAERIGELARYVVDRVIGGGGGT